MEEKTLKINNIEFNCQTLIEFSSLINALIEMAKKQKEAEKKLNEHDIKINNLIKLIQAQQKELKEQKEKEKEKEIGIGWQDKENELSNILNDEHIFSMNYNNSNLSNYINNETLNDAPKQNNNNINNNVTEEKQITEEKEDKEEKEENIQNKEKESKEAKEIPITNYPIKIIKEDIKVKKIENQEILNDNNQKKNSK